MGRISLPLGVRAFDKPAVEISRPQMEFISIFLNKNITQDLL